MSMTVKNSVRKILLITLSALFCLNVSAQSNTWYEAMSLARKIKAEVFYEAFSKSIVFSKDGLTVRVTAASPILIVDDTQIELCTPAKISENKFLISADMARHIENFFSKSNEAEPLFKVAAILIDPGHGGKDSGAIGSYTQNGKKIKIKEKDIVLDVGLELQSMLKKTFPDKKIIMTRDTDTYPSLEARVELANSIKLENDEAIIYISIHANASFNRKAKGFEVWFLPRDYKRYDLANDKNIANEIKPIVNSMIEEEFTLESILMAKNILANLNKTIGYASISRGLKEQAWFVIRNSKMPSVLVELGFVTNEEEARLLNDPSYLNKCAVGIYNGIVQFINQFENHSF